MQKKVTYTEEIDVGKMLLEVKVPSRPILPPPLQTGKSAKGQSSSMAGISQLTSVDSSSSSTSMGQHQLATKNFHSILSGQMQISQQRQMPAALTNIQSRQKVYT
jgi:hypothetical protein